jgi:hypothetical protein
MFTGRRAELEMISKRVDHIRRTGEGRSMAIRGRRQIGKSRLVQELCDRTGLPYCFHTAVKGASATEAVNLFHRTLRESSLLTDTARALLPTAPPTGGWGDMLRLLAAALPEQPSIVVLDELPWLSEHDSAFDGHLQVTWDRLMSHKPVLLLLLGSDLHMMQRLTEYDRPFYGRADNMILGPFTPAETAAITNLTGADAIDAQLVTGGLPGLALRWPNGVPALDFLTAEVRDPTSAFFGVPEQALASEFPAPDTTRRVIEAIGGSGGRTFSNIAGEASDQSTPLSSGTLAPLLQRLTGEKQILAVDRPLSTRPSKLAQYRIADSNLRLYLTILRDVHQQALRGRTLAGQEILAARWSAWRGNAVEPMIREALTNAAFAGELPWPGVHDVGNWWNRQSTAEIDLVGADRNPVANRVMFAGSIKWQDGPFDRHHLAELQRDAPLIPGFDAGCGLVVVSRSGTALPPDAVDVIWSPDDVVRAWPS